MADSKVDMNGSWAGDGQPTDPVTVLQALKQKYPQTRLRYETGCDVKCETDAGFVKAVDAAKDSDFTILVVGESADMSGEASSRGSIDLPGKQLDLIKAVHATRKPYAIVLMNGRPLTINWLAANSPAILETWFGGTEAGNAIVDTLFGDANPGGKLPITFPRSVGQIPIYYNHKNTGRPFKASEKYTSKYLDIENTPLYPFGYGLSYTKFSVENLKLDKLQIKPSESIRVRVDVTNNGKISGDEVVQLYINDVAASVTRPVKELRGFKRITLKAGEKQTVEFVLSRRHLEFLDRDLKPVIEPGEFQVFVGTSSDNGLQSVFEVVTAYSTTKPVAAIPDAGPIEPAPVAPTPTAVISPEDNAFLEDMQRRAFQYFWDHTNPANGLTLDRAATDGKPKAKSHNAYNISSLAASGFALTGNCIAAERGWFPKTEVRARTKNALDFFANRAFNKNGWFYHWMDHETGERRWNSEISSIDTALLLGGVLTVRNCFSDDKEIVQLADQIYRRVDFNWMLNGDPYLLSHGWRPESGWITNRWNDYSEQMILYLLAIGSPTHPIPARSWYALKRDWREYGGYRYLAAVSPLFIHQYSHAWVDFRGRREKRPPYVDYFENSVNATRAQQKFFADVLSKEYPKYSPTMWGMTASDSQLGYIAWGAPPRENTIDGTVVPCAAAGSLMFTPEITLPVLKEIKSNFGEKIFGRYSFADAFNPHNGWVNTDVIGIDLGISVVSAENLRSGNVWHWFMQNDEIRRALKRVSLDKAT